MALKTWFINTDNYVSLNEYKSLNWRKLKKRIDPLKIEFIAAIRREKIPLLEWMELTVTHNTRLDMDNITGTVKPFVDCLRTCNVLIDDTAKQWDILIIKHDKELKRGTIRFEITGVKKVK